VEPSTSALAVYTWPTPPSVERGGHSDRNVTGVVESARGSPDGETAVQ
jgi:hypothetical protein